MIAWLRNSPAHYTSPDRRHSCAEKGQATVEFALTFGIFVFLLMCLFDFGRGVAAYAAISNAAREGARFAVHNPIEFATGRDGNVKAEVRDRTPMLVGLTDADILVWPGEGARNIGTEVTVTVSYTFSPVTPMISAFLPGGTLPLTASAKTVVQ